MSVAPAVLIRVWIILSCRLLALGIAVMKDLGHVPDRITLLDSGRHDDGFKTFLLGDREGVQYEGG